MKVTKRGNASVQRVQGNLYTDVVYLKNNQEKENNQEKDKAFEIHKSAELVLLETGYYTIELVNARI